MEFIAVKSVRKMIERQGAQQEFSDLQCALIDNPELGMLIPGTGGLRKLISRGFKEVETALASDSKGVRK